MEESIKLKHLLDLPNEMKQRVLSLKLDVRKGRSKTKNSDQVTPHQSLSTSLILRQIWKWY
jgi:hypothetical protein